MAHVVYSITFTWSRLQVIGVLAGIAVVSQWVWKKLKPGFPPMFPAACVTSLKTLSCEADKQNKSLKQGHITYIHPDIGEDTSKPRLNPIEEHEK